MTMRLTIIFAIVALLVALAGGVAYALTPAAASDCCYPGSPCCYPGSPCCSAPADGCASCCGDDCESCCGGDCSACCGEKAAKAPCCSGK
jgi:hypothetical protein